MASLVLFTAPSVSGPALADALGALGKQLGDVAVATAFSGASAGLQGHAEVALVATGSRELETAAIAAALQLAGAGGCLTCLQSSSAVRPAPHASASLAPARPRRPVQASQLKLRTMLSGAVVAEHRQAGGFDVVRCGRGWGTVGGAERCRAHRWH